MDFSIACSTRQDSQRSFLIEEKAPFSPIYTLIHGIPSLYSSDHANWAIRRLLLIIWLHRFFLDSFAVEARICCFVSKVVGWLLRSLHARAILSNAYIMHSVELREDLN